LLYPTGFPTCDVDPGSADFDGSGWRLLDGKSLVTAIFAGPLPAIETSFAMKTAM
jgi:hypothetical protein